LNWQASENANKQLPDIADQLKSIFAENYNYAELVNGGTNALSKVELEALDAETLKDLVDLGAITSEVAEEINNIELSDELTLEDTISANLQQTFKQAFGENWATGEVGALIEKIPVSMRDRFGQAIS
jgi:hypothetical protein